MKRVTVLLLSVFVVGTTNAQKIAGSEVPATVQQTFTQKFPNAKGVKWEKEDNTIEAEFKLGKEEYSASFDQAGKWLETESDIKKDKLPEAVSVSIAKEFSGYKIEKVEKLETPDRGLLYEVELEKKETTYEVRFTAEGKIIKKEEMKESDEKKEKD